MPTALNRRNFLKGAALSAAGVVAGGALAACSPQGQTSKDGAGTGGSGAGADGKAASATNSADQKWTFEIPPDPVPDDKIANVVETDVVVVGGGISGLVSAASCLEGGLSVTLISASKAPVSRGGSNNAVYSKVMEQMGLPKMDPTWFYRMQYAANNGNIKPAFWYKFYNNSETAMNWLLGIAEAAGIKASIESGPEYAEPDPMFTPPAAHAFYVEESELEGKVGTGEPHIAAELARYIGEDLKGDIHWETKGEQLVRDEGGAGRVSAVVASGADGAFTKYIGHKAVILATGDFSHDADMMAKYCPEAVELCDFSTDVNYDQGLWMGGLMPGDGQKMGLWVGAAWQKTQPNVFMLGRPNLPCDQPYTSHTGLMVDKRGQRFMNEDVLGGLACATILHVPESTAYCIWGTNRAAAGHPWGKPNYPHGSYFATPEEFIKTWDDDTYGFGIVKDDTIEGVIEKLGLPKETVETVARYNELCAAGRDDDFYKAPEKMIGITNAPFYGCPFKPGFLTSLGGLRTNIDLQVCDEADEPIPGLYNVGSMIGDFYAGVYTFAMEGMNYGATCITLPYVLGRDLAAGKLD